MTMSAVSRGDFFKQSVGVAAATFGAAAMPQIAGADGAVSKATVERARGVYGSRVADLADAVSAGNFAAVAEEKNAFALFNSGAYARNKAARTDAVLLADKIFEAVEKKDAAALKSSYSAYMKYISLDTPFKGARDLEYSQGYSSDYDWKNRTKKGTIYVRVSEPARNAIFWHAII
jgi:hypothetical protein